MSYEPSPQRPANFMPNDGQHLPGHIARAQPGEKVNMVGAVKNFFRKYFQFSGRASRSEYWWVQLAIAILTIVLFAIYVLFYALIGSNGEPPSWALSLFFLYICVVPLIAVALMIPNISLTVRRLHDANYSGWLYLICLIPFGSFALLVLCAMESNPAGAAYDA